ncbi:dynamin family protein [Aspergillus piperis CBS 112811]|uniref:Dynamin family protein n=1 Tax=Aspergillus piperis CBS 112811 TaxID=1448313 RepID=A0A8G1R4C9_9EURO|nr:dynamin family protein [Aspergillus piperis CBS 112811]RAH57510.1 dynamin family protein [Aspergillus piperis CBS 112811]
MAPPEAPNVDSIDLIASDMKELVRKIQDLRHLGIEDKMIVLPKICVIGDQSAGKSSLIEGMSEIKVPRSAGTCTRCPMEINLCEGEPDQPWTCKVFLSRKYMYDASKKGCKFSKKSQPLGPWLEQEQQEDELFTTLTDKPDLVEVIRWAQLAILNPGRPSSEYLPGQNSETDPDYCQVKFSPNVVRLDISAPGFPNLSFYDLPGVISQAEQEGERYLVHLVENLVKHYILQKHCIVLLTLPMTNDATNSSAARIVQTTSGANARAMGVLTKPDRIQTGESYAQWIEILEGDKFSLGHGYFVVRNNPDPAVEHSVAREEEEAFFAGEPWATDLALYRDKFGTRNLQATLSSLLLEQIQGCLPDFIKEINAKAERIEDELRTLPDPPSANVPYIICGKLNQLKEQIRAHIDGGSATYPMPKLWSHIAMDFKRALITTRPTVRMLSPSDKFPGPTDRDAEGSDSDCEMTTVPQPVKRKSPGEPGNISSVPEARQQPNPATTGTRNGLYWTDHFAKFNAPALTFTWEMIREINEDSYRAGLPDQTDPKAIEIMNQMSVKHWYDPLSVFLIATYRLVREMLHKQLNEVFLQYHQTGLYRELKRIIESFLYKLRAAHFEHAQENFSIEYNKPFTMALSALDQSIKSAYSFLAERRRFARAGSYLDAQGKYPRGDARREAELRKLTDAELGRDQFSQELTMMATSRGYYDLASSRFIDSICQSVHTKLFAKCRDDLIKEIERELCILDENALERCLELMEEDPDRQRRRQFLLREKERIDKAQEWLNLARKEDDQEDPFENVRIKSQPPDDWTT